MNLIVRVYAATLLAGGLIVLAIFSLLAIDYAQASSGEGLGFWALGFPMLSASVALIFGAAVLWVFADIESHLSAIHKANVRQLARRLAEG